MPFTSSQKEYIQFVYYHFFTVQSDSKPVSEKNKSRQEKDN
ncbi:hypothetical protein MY9_2286 [Bacillus sp. JS]|nr:hypothetical protein MY9_2286 [Bacillus sp. JS]